VGCGKFGKVHKSTNQAALPIPAGRPSLFKTGGSLLQAGKKINYTITHHFLDHPIPAGRPSFTTGGSLLQAGKRINYTITHHFLDHKCPSAFETVRVILSNLHLHFISQLQGILL
jgi:hypothetical protein